MESSGACKRKCVKNLSRLILGCALLLVFYVISLGPALAFCRRPVWPGFGMKHVPHPDNVWIDRLYAPLYDFREPFGCMPEFADASPLKQDIMLGLRSYVEHCQSLKYSLKKYCPARLKLMVPGFLPPAMSQPARQAVW
ncbi:hypothetical protein Pan153_38570 [Gimesia panareensis]|uniref:Uncharacterized protein n=1 Tax=Gimesia panareensis TaxID=2527978 RepID=A0A518FS69_9PLAN|nr:hypothetical protein Pan153_38570 [Gimesia panareensis]